MPEILLDTHILIWWRLNSRRLSRNQSRVLSDLERRRSPAAISAISIWEMAMLAARGRIEVKQPLRAWLEEMESHPMIDILPLTARIAAESTQLGPEFHNDPADQIIVATARLHGLRLMTADERICKWGKVALV